MHLLAPIHLLAADVVAVEYEEEESGRVRVLGAVRRQEEVDGV